MTFADIFSSDFLLAIVLRATVVGLLVSLCSSLLGVSLVMKRYSMIGDGLSHVGFFALAIASVAGVSTRYSLEVAVPIVILAAVLILKLSESKKIGGDAACAIVSTGSIAIGTLIYNFSDNTSTDICNSLFGSSSVITITNKDMWISIGLSLAVILYFALYYRLVFAVTFDETFSAAAGCSVSGFRTVLAVLTGITIVVGMKMMGAIMISALIVFPALTATRIAKSFKGVVISATVISVLCFIIGFALACRFNFQTGATVVTVDLIAFIGAIIFDKVKSSRRKKSV